MVNVRRTGLLISVSILISLVILSNNQTLSENYNDEWWNSSWNFRFRIDVNTSDYSRDDWPVEYAVNFTQILETLNITGEFDNNSIRVIEYNASGSPLGERIMQFDPYLNYNSTGNADGELLFLLNGTTPNQTTRYFYVYFDILESGAKQSKTYSTELNQSWDGEEFAINTTGNYSFFFDTLRNENSSGLYKAYYWDGQDVNNYFTPSGGGEKTREWTEITDGTYNYTFDFRYNATITAGPLRVTVRQEGDEVYWNDPDNRTNQSIAVKTYKFYYNHTWYLLEHNITNTYNDTIYRQGITGIPRFDYAGAYPTNGIAYDYSTDPGSWVWATTDPAGKITVIINVNESIPGMTADNQTWLNTTGISFPNTSISVNQSIWEISSFYFTTSAESASVPETRDRLISPVVLNISPVEKLSVFVEALTDYPIYNRNETITITGNNSFDPWNVTYSMNATLDRGTPQQGDDIEMILYDDGSNGDSQPGDNVFTNTYSLNNSENTGEWNLTIKYYDQNNNYLNESYYLFNLTDQFYANLTIDNPTGLPRLGNATFNVTNYMQTTPVTGATVNCTTDETDIPPANITDNGDGTYSINFTTPIYYGLFNLSCTAQKDGNNRTDEMNYTVEAPTTNLSIILQPSSYIAYNVTWYENESFNLHLTLNNTWQSNSYDTNVTVTPSSGEIQSNVTFTSCGTIPISMQCQRDFNITIINATSPANFSINVSVEWSNLDTTKGFNYSIFNISVQSNPVLTVLEENITGIIAPGNDTIISAFTIESSGNDMLNDTNFTVYGLGVFNITFIPVNITTLNAGQQQVVDVQVSALPTQDPGHYNGTINITTSSGYYELPFLIIVSGTNISITRTPSTFTSYNVTFYRNESFELFVNTNNTGNTTAFNAYINISIPANWYSNSSGVFCGNLSKGEDCSENFNITIASGTNSGNYTVNVTVTWDDIRIGSNSNTTQTNVSVVQNLSLQVLEQYVNLTTQHGTNGVAGNFTIVASGNDILYNISYNLTGLENLTINFTPQNISSLTVGQNQTVNISLSLPYGFFPSNHSGTLNISSENNGFRDLYININIPVNGSWVMNDTDCEHIEDPETGVACSILINNTGNIELNFTVNQSSATPPGSSNFTWAEYQNFTIQKQNSTILNIMYDLTGQSKIYYNYTYNISANQTQAVPQFSLYNVILNPFVQPLVNVSLNTSSIEQGSSIHIWAVVNSLSGASMDPPGGTVLVNITQPGGISTNITMAQFQSGNPSNWTSKYPVDDFFGLWGNTTPRGNYTVEVTAIDSYGMNGTGSTTFNVYTKLVPLLSTGTDIYEQGETISLNYMSGDFAGLVLSNVTVNIDVKNSNQETIYNKTLVTNQNGGFDVLESLSIPSDAVTGTYTVNAYSQYYDQDANITVYNTSSSVFTVVESGGLVSDVSTAVVWYPTSTMTFTINIYDGNGIPADPDEMNLTVYVGSPLLNNIYFTAQIGDPIVQEIENGFYVISYVMPSNTSPGDYWAVLRASKGTLYTLRNHPFRVATGGPYDVIIDQIEPEVQQGTYLDFSVIIENMGEFGQDVDLDYWITDQSSTEWSRSSAAVFTPAGQNITFSNDLFVFSNQPLGINTFHFKVTYSNLQNPIEKSATFSVIPFTEEPEEPGPEPGGGPGEPAGPAGPTPSVADMETDFYRDEIGVEAGVNKTIRFRINNTGGLDIGNISLSILGIQSNWYVFQPAFIETLKTDGYADIDLIFTVPKGTPQGSHRATLVIDSDDKDIKKLFTLTIFTSREELIRFELTRLKEKTSNIEYDAREAQEREGKDMSRVFAKIKEIKEQIDIAEEFLDNEMYEDALDAIYTGWELYREALYLFEHAPSGLALPWQIIATLIIIIFVAVFGIYMYKQRRLLKTIVRSRVSGAYSGGIGAGARFKEAKSVVQSIQKQSAEVDELKNKRDKLTRTLGLLETQKKQGIISKEAYLSMKKSTDEKITKLEEQIRKAISS
jgi:uncharacterized membrane protein